MRAYDLNALNVILVEPNEFNRTLFRRILREFGIRNIREEVEPQTAFNKFTSDPADLIFSTWGPKSDALRFLQLVRTNSSSPKPFVPIIVVSAYTEADYVMKARDLGMNEYLVLPTSASLIYERICWLIERPRPFVRASSYVGPDRRRKALPYDGEERRQPVPS